MVVFDREGRFIASWGEEVLKDAHGIFIDDRDQIWCVERETHCVRQFTRDGELLLTLETPDQEGADGQPFRLPTDLALDADGCIYVSDGYGNTCIHKYSPDGEFIKTWGRPGTGPGEFDLPHCVRVDQRGRLMVADRAQQPHPVLRPRRQLPRGVGRLPPSRYHFPRRRYGLCRGTRPAGEHSQPQRRMARPVGIGRAHRPTRGIPRLPPRHLDGLKRRPLRWGSANRSSHSEVRAARLRRLVMNKSLLHLATLAVLGASALNAQAQKKETRLPISS